MHHALARVALLQLAQVQTGAKMIAFAMQDRCAHCGGHVIKGVLQIGDQPIVQGIALERARQAQHRHGIAQLNVQVG
jgi:hypothetical protein